MATELEELMIRVSAETDDAQSSLDELSSTAESSFQQMEAAAAGSLDAVSTAAQEMAAEVESSSDALDSASASVAAMRTPARGLSSTFRGLNSTMSGFGKLAQGDVVGGLQGISMGVANLTRGLSTALIPGLQATRNGFLRATSAVKGFVSTSRGAALAAGGVGAALAAAFIIYQSFIRESEAASISTENLIRDLEHLRRTGQLTGDATKALDMNWQDATAGLNARTIPVLGKLAEQTQKLTTGSEHLDDLVLAWQDALPGFGREAGEAADMVGKLDESLAGMLAQGVPVETVMATTQAAADQLGISYDQLTAQLPQYREELARVNDQQNDAQAATRAHVDSLAALGDALRAQTDPVFAFANAQRQVKEAQNAVNEAEDEFGRRSPQWRDANLRLAEAQIRLQGAASDVASEVDGSLMPVLRQMRDDGLISADAFRELKRTLDRAKDSAERLDGTRVNVQYTLDIFRYNRTPHIRPPGAAGGVEMFASGGIVTGPTLAMIGEGAHDEAVIPLPPGWRNLTAGGDGSNQGSVDYQELARTVGRAVAQQLDGVTLVVDDRGRGRLEALQAGYYRRAG